VPAGAVDVALPADLVAVQVIRKAALADVRRGVRLAAGVFVLPVVAGALLRDRTAACDGDHIALLLGEDVVVAVVGHRQGVVAHLVGGGLVFPFCLGQAVEVVVAEALLVRAAEGGGRRDGDLVVEAEDVADVVVAVVEGVTRRLAAS